MQHPVPDQRGTHHRHLDLGGRIVTVTHPGHGHTDGDLFAYVDDADVLVAGDLVEESGPPDFGDAYPLEWPESVGAMLHVATPATMIVPGHGVRRRRRVRRRASRPTSPRSRG